MGFTIENGELVQYIEEPGITEVVIPDNVTSIDYFAFNFSCKRITSIKIPDNAAGIESVAFDNCRKLMNITVSEDNPLYCDIDGVVFSKDKTKLLVYPRGRSGEYTVPNGVISINLWAFSHCKRLTNIMFPDSLTDIGDFAFLGCKRLTQITIPDSVKRIGNDAFSDCKRLTNITIPDNLNHINLSIFQGCESLTAITVSENNPTYCDIDGVLFSKDKTKLLYCPIGKSGEYTVPDGVASIGDEAFLNCKKLTGITIPDSVTNISDLAFYLCESLTSITIPDSVTSIGYHAFWSCESLTGITIPDGVTSIGSGAFWRCKKLERIDVSPDNCCFSSVDGKLYNKDKTKLIYNPKG